MGKQSRRGRPKKPGDRYKSGDIKPGVDRGADGLTARRIAATETPSGAADPRTESAWGILRARGLISEAAYLCGLSLARDWRRVYPERRLPACIGHLIPSGEGTIAVQHEGEAAAIAAAQRRIALAEHRAIPPSPRAWLMLVDAVLYDVPPDFTDVDRARTELEWQREETDRSRLNRAAEAMVPVYHHRPERDAEPSTVRQSALAMRQRRAARHRRT